MVVVRLRQDLKYRGHVYIEPVRPTHYIPDAFFSKITMDLSFADMFRFSDVAESQEQHKNVTEQNISDRKEASGNRNDTGIEYASA